MISNPLESAFNGYPLQNVDSNNYLFMSTFCSLARSTLVLTYIFNNLYTAQLNTSSSVCMKLRYELSKFITV